MASWSPKTKSLISARRSLRSSTRRRGDVATLTSASVTRSIDEVFRDAGTDGYLHAREIGSDGEVDVRADEQVVLASVFKILIGVAFVRAVGAGRLDQREQARL